jgi:CHAT domain-containing protein
MALGCSSARDPPDDAKATTSQGVLSVPESPLDSLIQAGIDAYQRGEYDSAGTLLGSVVELARADSNLAAVARALTALGLTAYRQGDYAAARVLGEEALALKIELDLPEELWRSYNALGLLAWNESRLSEAADLYLKAEDAATDLEDQTILAVISINRGLIHADLGNFEAARAAFENAREVSHQAGDARLEGMALNNLGMLGNWIGDPLGSIPYLEQAITLYQTVDFVPGELNALGQLGSAYTALGEMGKAIAALDSALAISRDRAMRQEEASNLETLAEAYRTAGQFRRALDLYAEAEAINAEVGLVQETGSDQRSRAEIYQELGDLQLARDFATRALETHRSVEARWEEFADLVALADLAHRAGHRRESSSFLKAARELARGFDARTARLEVALAEARIADRAGEWTHALRVLRAAGEDLSAGGYDTEWEGQLLRTRAFTRLGQLDSAVAAGRQAVAAVERVRVSFGSGLLRTSYSSNRLDAYGALVSALLQTGDIEGAFVAADQARGRRLLERHAALGSGSERQLSTAATFERGEELLRRVNELSLRLQELDEWLPAERDSTVVSDLQRQLAATRSRYEASRVSAIEKDASGSALLGARPVDPSHVQAALRHDQALLEYLVLPDRLVGFVVRSRGIKSFTHPITRDDLARRVRIARGLFASRQAAANGGMEVLKVLYQMLIEPARQALVGAERLVVIPHGVLTYLPFAAVVDPTTERFLAEDYVIHQLPSAGALSVLRGDREPTRSAEEVAYRVVGFAPLVRTLPASRDEVRALRQVISRAKLIEGRHATESRLRDALAEPVIVHVASHGVMNVVNPMFSRIELARGRGNRSNDDGHLDVHEVVDLSIRSPLVFLSGCETGAGPAWRTDFDQGESYSTLAQAFLYAGGQNVVATLWRVDDEASALFARSFYQALVERGPAEALVMAQRRMLEHPIYRSPYYWAGVQLYGSGELAGGLQGSRRLSVRQ